MRLSFFRFFLYILHFLYLSLCWNVQTSCMSLYTHNFVIQMHMVDIVQSTSVAKRVSENVLQSFFRVNIAYTSLFWSCVAVNPDSSAISFTLSAKPDTCSSERSSRKLKNKQIMGIYFSFAYKLCIKRLSWAQMSGIRWQCFFCLCVMMDSLC